MDSYCKKRLAFFSIALWWGSASCIGFLAVPLLFASLPTPALAGTTAAKLFSAQTWIALICGIILLRVSKNPPPDSAAQGRLAIIAPPLQGQWALAVAGWILAGMLCALLVEYAVAPRIVARENLALWHPVGTGLYLGQWLCATMTAWKISSHFISEKS